MKASMYNFVKEIDGKNILFNSKTGALITLDSQALNILKSIDRKKVFIESEQKYIEIMQKIGCIVSDDINELSNILSIRNKQKYNMDLLSLTILPTLDCNFRCTYCFEEHRKDTMTKSTQAVLIKFIEERIKSVKKLRITWFGGEPMLCKDIIYDLGSKIKELCFINNVKYESYMVSNGSLIEIEDIDKLKNSGLGGIQITVDGPKDIHESRRICMDGESFNKIISNINLLLELEIKVSIRINIDKGNVIFVDELLDYLKHNIKKYDLLNISFGKISSYTEICKNIKDNCFNGKDFESLRYDLYDKVVKYGFSKSKMNAYPKVKYNNCGAELSNSFVVDPNGYLYKCWNSVGNVEENCGSIFEDVKRDSYNYLNWVAWSPIEFDECRSCKVLPICMGSCPSNEGEPFNIVNKENNRKKPVCHGIKDNVDKMIEFYYKILKSNV